MKGFRWELLTLVSLFLLAWVMGYLAGVSKQTRDDLAGMHQSLAEINTDLVEIHQINKRTNKTLTGME